MKGESGIGRDAMMRIVKRGAQQVFESFSTDIPKPFDGVGANSRVFVLELLAEPLRIAGETPDHEREL